MAVGFGIDMKEVRGSNKLSVDEGVLVRSIVVWCVAVEDVGED